MQFKTQKWHSAVETLDWGGPKLASLILAACPTTKSGVAVMRGFQALASWTISQQGLIV